MSLRPVFLLIVVILIHIRLSIKQTAVMTNFTPLAGVQCVCADCVIVRFHSPQCVLADILTWIRGLRGRRKAQSWQSVSESCWIIVCLQKAHSLARDCFHVCALVRPEGARKKRLWVSRLYLACVFEAFPCQSSKDPNTPEHELSLGSRSVFQSRGVTACADEPIYFYFILSCNQENEALLRQPTVR